MLNSPKVAVLYIKLLPVVFFLIQSHFDGSAKYIVHFDEIDIFIDNPAPGSA